MSHWNRTESAAGLHVQHEFAALGEKKCSKVRQTLRQKSHLLTGKIHVRELEFLLCHKTSLWQLFKCLCTSTAKLREKKTIVLCGKQQAGLFRQVLVVVKLYILIKGEIVCFMK